MLTKINLLIRKNGVSTIQLAGIIMMTGLAVAAMTVYMKRAMNGGMFKSANYLAAKDGLPDTGLKQFEPDYVNDKMNTKEDSRESLGIADSFNYSKTGGTFSTGFKEIMAPGN